MSYEATFIKKTSNKEELLGYFRCTSNGYSVTSSLLDAIDVSIDMCKKNSCHNIIKVMDKISLKKALKYVESKGPDYYLKDKPYYPIKEVLQEVYDCLSTEDKVEIFLY